MDDYSLSHRYTADEGRVFLTGIQALARIPIAQLRADAAAGLRTAAFVSGYQGSPLGGFDQEMARATAIVPDLPIVFRPAVNEELAATAVMGSQLVANQDDAIHDGVLGVWYGKAPGLDRASDAIRHAVFSGASRLGGALALVGDDPASKSSTLPSSSDMALADLGLPVFYPGDVQEVLDLGRHAVMASRFSGLWSAMKVVTAVADGSGSIDMSPERTQIASPDLEVGGRVHLPRPNGTLIAPHTNEMEQEIVEVRREIARRYAELNGLNRHVADPDDPWLGLVATGHTYRELLEALRRLGLDSIGAIEAAGIRILQMRMPLPFDPGAVRRFARGLDEIMVVEEKGATLERLVKDALYGGPDTPVVVGKVDERGRALLQSHGFLTADLMVEGLRRRLAPRLADRLAPEPAPPRERTLIPLSTGRAPYFCSGCPHNWGTKAPDEALIGAGIGCSGMALLMDEEKVGDIAGITCMGTEGSQWIGMEPFLDRDHFIQNLGDGTYFHSGQLAIQAAVAAGSNMTYKLLYNGTVAMTGGQEPTGGLAVRDMAKILLTQGVTEVVLTTDDVTAYGDVDMPSSKFGGRAKVWDRARIVEAQRYLSTVPGVTVLIHDQACAAQTRRLRKRGKAVTPAQRIVINHRLCEACGDCGEVSNCLSVRSVDTPLGPKTAIDQTTCNLDFSCADGDCPSFMTVTPGRAAEKRADRSALGPAPPESFPDPRPLGSTDRIDVRLAGIGGTGVVTVAQILGTAAMFDGWEVRGLDQTGLSQKAGPVVSDLRLSRHGSIESNLVGAGEADVIVAFDLLVGASDQALTAASADRTVLVSSSSETPTGAMIGHPERPYPALAELRSRVSPRTRMEHNRYVDAGAVTRGLLGDAATANVFMLGVAVQAGALPVDGRAIERAIDLNGVAVEANLSAFRWGRQWSVDGDAVEAAAGIDPASDGQPTVVVDDPPRALMARILTLDLDDELQSMIAMLTADLVAYQDAAWAGAFLDLVSITVEAERSVDATSTELAEAVARGAHKLMAYKDEYEVARLLTGPEGMGAGRAVGGDGAKVAWKLQPPVFTSLGLSRKITINPRWGRPVMRLLAKARRLRGTFLDPFGRTEVRRMERRLIGAYVETIEATLGQLTAQNLPDAVDLARAAMEVRGYERLKLERGKILLARLARETAD